MIRKEGRKTSTFPQSTGEFYSIGIDEDSPFFSTKKLDIPEAPFTNKIYVRKDGQWVEFVPPIPPQPHAYLVTYDSNGGSGVPDSPFVVRSGKQHIIAAMPMKAGDIFEEWLGSDGNTYQPGDIIIVNDNITMIAQWQDVVIYNTEIIFDVTINSGNVNTAVTLLSLNGDPSKTFNIDYGDGNISVLNFQPPELVDSGTPGSDTFYQYEESPLITHIYANQGTFKVIVISLNHISNIKFSTVSIKPNEWVLFPVARPHITKIYKLRSDSITSLVYSLAGLTDCVPDSSFILETPLVNNMFATFHSFGRDDFSWTFNAALLSQLTLLSGNSMNNTFRECRMREIPIGFLDAQENVTSLYETWKWSYLGRGYYQGWTWQQFYSRSLAGTTFIPMDLFRNMKNLTRLFATFNALTISDQNLGSLSTDDGFGGWLNVAPLVRASFFLNGSAKGNAQGTITDISYVFGKINRVALESDLFRHIRHCLVEMSACFYETNNPKAQNVSRHLAGWPLLDEVPLTTDEQTWNDITSANLQPNPVYAWNLGVLGLQPFPNVKRALNAFCSYRNTAIGQEQDSTPTNMSFNAINGNRQDDFRMAIDNSIVAKFPAMVTTPGAWDIYTYQTGFDGMMFRFPDDYAETPNSNTISARTINVVTY